MMSVLEYANDVNKTVAEILRPATTSTPLIEQHCIARAIPTDQSIS